MLLDPAHAPARRLLIGVLLLTSCDGDGSSGDGVQGAPPGPTATQVDASLGAAEQYLLEGDLAEAEAIACVLAERAPSSFEALELLGRIRLYQSFVAREQGLHEQAAAMRRDAWRQYRAACDLSPGTAWLEQSAGEVAQAAGLDEDAMKHYRAAERADDANPKPPLYLGQLLMDHQRDDEAREAFHRVLAIDPHEPFSHASIGLMDARQGHRASAMSHILRARHALPANLPIRVTEARIHRLLGQPRRVLELLLPLTPEQRAGAPVTWEIADAWLALGEPGRAAGAWAHCFHGSPDDPRAWRWALYAAEASLEGHQQEQAAAWLARAKARNPDEASVTSLERRLKEVEPAP